MANKSVFAAFRGRLFPATTTLNRAGGPAYAHDERHLLAQLAMTGTFADAFYVDAKFQVDEFALAAAEVDPLFVAKAAIYARKNGHMKDAPAYLLAQLSTTEPALFARAFDRTVDNGRMLRTFVQIMRSGAAGRKSLGSRPKRMVQEWLVKASDTTLLNASVGQSPSLADIIKMVHPKAESAERNAFFAWLIGKPADVALLPQAVRDFLRFKETAQGEIPDVPFQMLTALPLTKKHWAKIAERGGVQMVRMNLNTFARQGVFSIRNMDQKIAEKLRDPDAIRKARVLPHELMMAYAAAGDGVPTGVWSALEDAMDIALENVPSISGSVAVCVDVSGSMQWPVTGHRKGASTKVRFVDVAALVAAAVQRKNRSAIIIPFDDKAHEAHLSPYDGVMTNATKLAAYGGGGTNCSAALRALNKQNEAPDLVVFVSDNQSWVDKAQARGTAMMAEWETLKSRNERAKLVCIDIAPYGTTQAKSREDILNVGGFSDAVFKTLASFAEGKGSTQFWVEEIEAVEV